MASFTLDAWISGSRWRHSREHDHFGNELDINVSIRQRIGPYEEGTPVHFVLEDLIARVVSIESTTKVRLSFKLDAYIWPTFLFLDAVISGPVAGSFTLDAVIQTGGSFSLNAVIRGGRSFALNAVIV